MSVKKNRRGRPGGSETQLDSSGIVNCAKGLMRTEGKAPSIRKIAGTLNVDAMAIYYYFSNKNALLEAVAVSLIGEIYQPSGEAPWQVELKRLCWSYLTLLKDHAGVLDIMLGMASAGPAEVFAKRFDIAVAPLELSRESRKDAMDLLADYLHGFALTMRNSPPGGGPNLQAADGPLDFYIRAITSETRTGCP